MSPVPARVRWAVDLLDPAPDAHVLEVGCGPGASVALIAERLTTGRVTAIDRSPVAVERARRRAAPHADRAVVLHADLTELARAPAALPGAPFDAALAVDVNLFWTTSAGAELRLLRDLLRPGAPLHLVHGDPGATAPPTAPARILDRLLPALTAAGAAPVVVSRAAPLAVTATWPV